MSIQAQLQTAVPDELSEEFLKRIPYLSEGIGDVRLLSGGSSVAFALRPGFEDQEGVVRYRISELADKLCANHQPGPARTLARQDFFPSAFHEDPHPLLIERGDIVLFGRGRYGFGPRIVRLIEYFDQQAREMAARFQADAYAFPSLVGADVLDRCRYLRNFPTSLNLVSHLREDHQVLQEFARSVQWDGRQLVYDASAASGVECLLSPSVCFHWYQWLRDSQMTRPRAITALGKCFRYESSNLTGLERLWDFSMREIVFVGPDRFVLENRDKLVDLCAAYLSELGLAFEISTATDPFFIDSYAVQAAYQQGFELKFELLTPLPYSKKRLAVGSINYHQDFFGRSFNIQADGSPAHTGCLGFGYERLALAFLAQHGLKETAWPKRVAAAVRTAAA